MNIQAGKQKESTTVILELKTHQIKLADIGKFTDILYTEKNK